MSRQQRFRTTVSVDQRGWTLVPIQFDPDEVWGSKTRSRRLRHGRDLAAEFDFLTWFDYQPADAEAFEELVRRLRKTTEWTYVTREVDIRLSR